MFIDQFFEAQRECKCTLNVAYLTKRLLYQAVEDFHGLLGIYGSAQPLELLKELEPFLSVEYHGFNSKGICGGLVKNKKFEKSYMFINSSLDIPSQNFAAMHEIVHFIGHRQNVYECKQLSFRQSAEEWQANEGAAELLVPHKEFIHELGLMLQYPVYKERVVYDGMKYVIVSQYGVSTAVITYRIEGLKYEIYQYLHGVNINELDLLSRHEQKARGIHVSTLDDDDYRAGIYKSDRNIYF